MGALIRAAGFIERVGRSVAAPFVKDAGAPGWRWFWPTGQGDMGPPGSWQMNRNPVADPSTLAAFSAVYACVNRIAGDLAKLPIRIVELADNGEQRDLVNDPFEVLLRRPNDYQTRVDFIQSLMSATLLMGDGYAYMPRNGRNEPRELHCLDPRTTQPRIGADGSVFYSTAANKLAGLPNGAIIPARDIIHHRLPFSAAFPLRGITPIYAAASSGSLGLRILQQSQQFYANMARPSGMLSTEQNLAPESAKELGDAWNANYREGGSGKTAVLPNGLKWQAITMDATDSQLIEQLRFSIEDVARAFGVPVFLIGDTSKVTYRNSEQLARAYLQNTLGYHLEALQERFNLAFDFGNKHRLIFDLDALLKTDIDARFAAYEKALRSGFSINEIRALEGYGPKKGGEEPMVQMQMVPLSIAVENAKNPPAPAPAAAPVAAPADDPAEDPADDPNADKDFEPDDDDEIDDVEAGAITAQVAALLGV